ncbi:hypothetical protein [Mycolicibacterium baixiangningiae]|uniref:hypothetical protein n=1 Tax=Mycolicibacterium baixiangningiae TaxID=2761578 RepID=UPI001867EF2E|nr:hypothetical protein [Mycolicibacterium baixiangningiae]
MPPGPQPNGAARSRSTALAVVACLIATAALALSGWTWWQVRTAPTYDAADQTAAKDSACAAFAQVRTGVATNTHLESPGGDSDVTGVMAVAANARVALMGGGQYLLASMEPATPPELAEPLRQFGMKLMEFGAAATAGAPDDDPGQRALKRDLDGLNATLDGLCG